MQVACWKTRDGKHWLKLHQKRNLAGQFYFTYRTRDGGRDLDSDSLEDALRFVQEIIIAHWPSKGVRQH